MEGDVVTPGGIVIPASALTWRFSHSGGPGGQGVNTSDSRVELLLDLTRLDPESSVHTRVRRTLGEQVRIVAAADRSQLRNREAALRRLAERVDIAARVVPSRTPTRPTRGSMLRRLEAKRRQARRKSDRGEGGRDDHDRG